VITALTDVIAGNIFPQIALASIINIIANPKSKLVLDQPSIEMYALPLCAE
jgi:hypothetical protein